MTDRPRFRWRIIPAWFLMTFGGMLFLITNASFIVMLVWHGSLQIRGSYQPVIGLGLMQIAALCWLVSGRLILAGKWKWMLLPLVIGYVAGVFGASFHETFDG